MATETSFVMKLGISTLSVLIGIPYAMFLFPNQPNLSLASGAVSGIVTLVSLVVIDRRKH